MAGQKPPSAILLLALLILGFASCNTANARAVVKDKRVYPELPKSPSHGSGPSHGTNHNPPPAPPLFHPSLLAHRVH